MMLNDGVAAKSDVDHDSKSVVENYCGSSFDRFVAEKLLLRYE